MSDHHHGCDDCRRTDSIRRGFDRRLFLRAGGLTALSWGLAPRFVGNALAATEGASGRKILVCVFQRGAVDGLSMVVPHGERDYYKARPNIAIPGPGRGDGRAIDLDGFFGLHPALSELSGWFESGDLAVVHAVGSPDTTRSHFDAQDYMESGTPGIKSTRDGWLNRLLQARGPHEVDSLLTRAVAMTDQLPLSLAGAAPALAVGNLAAFIGEGGGDAADPARGRRGMRDRSRYRSPAVMEGFEALYGRDGQDLVVDTGAAALEAVSLLRAAKPGSYAVTPGAQYPRSQLGLQLRQVAQLIKADVGLEIAFTDSGGWDTHVNQGGAEGQLARQLDGFGGAIAAFARDIEHYLDDVIVLTMSEFGRTVEENGNRGTDHGHANASFVLGGGVAGGKVYGRWPGLDRDQRFEGRDLALTTDFRDLFSEVVHGHLEPSDLTTLFPGHQFDVERRLGLIQASYS